MTILRLVTAIITVFSAVFAIAELWFGLGVSDLPIDPIPVVIFVVCLIMNVVFYVGNKVINNSKNRY